MENMNNIENVVETTEVTKNHGLSKTVGVALGALLVGAVACFGNWVLNKRKAKQEEVADDDFVDPNEKIDEFDEGVEE